MLKDGKIAERGTHAALLDRGGLYAAMWDRQREADEAAERLRRTRESDASFFPQDTEMHDPDLPPIARRGFSGIA